MAIYYWVIFLFFITVFVYPFGELVLSVIKFKEKSLIRKFFLGSVIGLWLITLEGFILGKAGFAKLTPVLVVCQSASAVIYRKRALLKGSLVLRVLPVILVFVAVFINSTITVPFGIMSGGGPVRFAGAHSVDTNWHLSLINSIQKGFPIENPIFSGTTLANYHYLVDLQIALIQTLTRIPVDILFYQIIGPFYILLYSAMAYILGRELSRSEFGGIASMLLVSLSSNWYYLANYFYPSSYKWPSVGWVDYFSTKSVNYHLLFSITFLICLIYFLLKIKSLDAKKILFISVASGSLMAIKSPVAIVLLGGLLGAGLILSLKKKYGLLITSVAGIFVGLLFTLWTFPSAKNMLIVQPFWFIKTMYEGKDRLNFDIWELKRQYLLSVGSHKGVAKLYAQGLITFLLINLGFLPLGLFALVNKVNKVKREILLTLLFISLSSIVLTLTFINRGIAFNTIQFFYPAIITLSFLFSVVLVDVFKKRRPATLIVFFLFWLSFLPGVVFTLNIYSPKFSTSISNGFVDAVQFLETRKPGGVLVDETSGTNSLVSAYSKKPTYFSEEILLSTLLVNFEERKTKTKEFFSCENENRMRQIIKEGEIKYVFARAQNICLESFRQLQKIFSNEEVKVYVAL